MNDLYFEDMGTLGLTMRDASLMEKIYKLPGGYLELWKGKVA